MTRRRTMLYGLAMIAVVTWLLIASYVGIWGGILWQGKVDIIRAGQSTISPLEVNIGERNNTE